MAPSPSYRTRPLSTGNVVSAGISLLRTYFKTYLGLSAKAVLWYLIPFYGWARALMIFGQIGRLGFQEIIHQPETVNASLKKVEFRMWSFLGVAILVFIIQVAANYAISGVGTALILPFTAVGAGGDAVAILSGVLVVGVQLAMFAAQTWIQARFLLYDVIIAVETETDATAAITRSWELTQGSAFRVLLVLLVAYVVMAPLFVLALLPFLFTIPFFAATPADTPDPALALALLLAFLVFAVLLMLGAVITVPFWQSIKAVLYYDLRSRREGIDIQLTHRIRDRERS
ncbi:MAG: DUF975 domain-containing protein [Leptolyngbya sp. SIO1E4]|nr:DUF975 domain-containing protein [Leptolyngbya sp. SIO1E4]